MVCFVDVINIVVNSAGVAVFGNNIFSSSKEDRNNKGDEQRRKQRKASVRIRLTLYFRGVKKIPFRDGLTKIHKPGCPFRPIVFSVNTYNYNLASYLVDILLPISANQFTVKASFSFAHWAKSYNYNSEMMCCFDFSSLFTNVPLDETIQFYLINEKVVFMQSRETQITMVK